jgi:hypothetical protein
MDVLRARMLEAQATAVLSEVTAAAAARDQLLLLIGGRSRSSSGADRRRRARSAAPPLHRCDGTTPSTAWSPTL